MIVAMVYPLKDRALSPQEMFVTVARHLFKQGRQSLSGNVRAACAYRGMDGMSCAVGCLIPDDLYVTRLEGVRVTSYHFSDVVRGCLLGDSLLENDMMLNALQHVHDTESYWRSTRDMRTALDKVAREFALDDSVVGMLGFGDARDDVGARDV